MAPEIKGTYTRIGIHNPQGQIDDPGVAWEVAHLEKPARDREIELERQLCVGLTQEQEDNIALMNGLQEKYPKVFKEQIDGEGRKALTVKIVGEPARKLGGVNQLIICQEGFFGVSDKIPIGSVNITAFLNAVIERGKIFHRDEGHQPIIGLPASQILTQEAKNRSLLDTVVFGKINFKSTHLFDSLKTVFEANQAENMRLERIHQESEKPLDIQAILAKL